MNSTLSLGVNKMNVYDPIMVREEIRNSLGGVLLVLNDSLNSQERNKIISRYIGRGQLFTCSESDLVHEANIKGAMHEENIFSISYEEVIVDHETNSLKFVISTKRFLITIEYRPDDFGKMMRFYNCVELDIDYKAGESDLNYLELNREKHLKQQADKLKAAKEEEQSKTSIYLG